jgi:hypothetical protein
MPRDACGKRQPADENAPLALQPNLRGFQDYFFVWMRAAVFGEARRTATSTAQLQRLSRIHTVNSRI